MQEMTPEHYRAEARRCHDLAEKANDPIQKVLYRQMERQLPHPGRDPGNTLPAPWRDYQELIFNHSDWVKFVGPLSKIFCWDFSAPSERVRNFPP
jgi:hypothetical protein